MRADVIIFILILIINSIVAFLYWLYFSVINKQNEGGFVSRFIVMLLCPIIGPLYFVFGWILRKIFFHKPVDLSDVIFSKEREKSLLKTDEKENNILPINDAVTVVDTQNARELMIEVLRHDVRKSLSSLFLAMNSDDSEISHYAASVLQSELGKFRNSVQKEMAEIDRIEGVLQENEKYDGQKKTPAGKQYSRLLAELKGETYKEDDEDIRKKDDLRAGREKKERKHIFADLSDKLEQSEDYYRHELSAHEQGLRAFYGDEIEETTLTQMLNEEIATAHGLIASIYEVLKQNVLSEQESIHFTELITEIAQLLEKRDILSVEEMAQLAESWRLRTDYENCAQWSDHINLVYPGSLESFSTRLKLYYDTDNREQFFAALNEMKASGVPLDHEMIELVRIFN